MSSKSKSVEELSDQLLKCRAWGHKWSDPIDVVTARSNAGNRGGNKRVVEIMRTRTCERNGCTVEQTIGISDWTKTKQRRTYPDGYLLDGTRLYAWEAQVLLVRRG